MVNPERRATLEEIAGHWWLNWGYQLPLLAQNESAAARQGPDRLATACQTGGPTRIADWLRRTSRPLLQSGSKMRCLLRSGGAAGGEPVQRQRSIRRSRKENNVSQTMQESSAPRPHKGILKKRGSLRQKPTPVDAQTTPLEEKSPNTAFTSSVAEPSVLPPPPKGILKKPPESKSDYYSSSPESGDSTQTRLCPSSMGGQRKGILKRHGKFSSGLQEFGSLDQLASTLPAGGNRSRPSGAISEDSILSSESFDRLDLPDREIPVGPMDRPSGGGRMRGCVSVDNLLDRSAQRQGRWETDTVCYRAGVSDSAFSIAECQNVTQTYKEVFVKA